MDSANSSHDWRSFVYAAYTNTAPRSTRKARRTRAIMLVDEELVQVALQNGVADKPGHAVRLEVLCENDRGRLVDAQTIPEVDIPLDHRRHRRVRGELVNFLGFGGRQDAVHCLFNLAVG